MLTSLPYRLQIFVFDELRAVLREIAHRKHISLQRLVVQWLVEKARAEPEGQHLAPPDES